MVICMSMQSIFCMKQSTKEDRATTALVKLEQFEDVRKFAGHVVTYTTNAYYFGLYKGYQIHTDKRIKYAYIGTDSETLSSGEKGYNLYQFLTKEQVSWAAILTDSTIARSPIRMGLATMQEANQISAAIKFDEAKFEYHDDISESIAQKHSDYVIKLKEEYVEHMVEFLSARPRAHVAIIVRNNKRIKKENYPYASPFSLDIARLIANFRYAVIR